MAVKVEDGRTRAVDAYRLTCEGCEKVYCVCHLYWKCGRGGETEAWCRVCLTVNLTTKECTHRDE